MFLLPYAFVVVREEDGKVWCCHNGAIFGVASEVEALL